MRIFLERKPCRQKQIQFIGNLSKMIKWCNFFLATSFHHPRTFFYFSLISSWYIERKTTKVNNMTWATTLNVHPNTSVFFFFEFCLPVLGVVKGWSGYYIRWISFCSVICACAKNIALMNWRESNFRFRSHRKLNLYWCLLYSYNDKLESPPERLG